MYLHLAFYMFARFVIRCSKPLQPLILLLQPFRTSFISCISTPTLWAPPFLPNAATWKRSISDTDAINHSSGPPTSSNFSTRRSSISSRDNSEASHIDRISSPLKSKPSRARLRKWSKPSGRWSDPLASGSRNRSSLYGLSAVGPVADCRLQTRL